MKRKTRFREIVYKCLSLMLVVFLSTGLAANGSMQIASAATMKTMATDPVSPADPAPPEVTGDNGLQSDSTQASQAQAMGFSTDQPARISPSGQEVDKNQNPLGPNNLTMNRIYQLALSEGPTYNVFKNPLGSFRMFKNVSSPGTTQVKLQDPVAAGTSLLTVEGGVSWTFAERAIAAADIDGNGKQEVVTAGLLPVGTDGKNVSLHLLVGDYNNLTGSGKNTRATTKDYTVVSSMSDPSGTSNTDQSLRAVAGDFDRDGKDEIAIAAGSSLYLCKADMSTEQTLSTMLFALPSILVKSSIADVEAADVNGDGFPELLVTKKAGTIVTDKNDSSQPKLYIYNGVDLSKASAVIPLSVTVGESTKKEYIKNAGVALGDAFGTGEKVILLGGATTGNNMVLTYVTYHPATDSYDQAPVLSYALDAADFKAVQGDMGLKCVSLKTPVPGVPQYVVLGGFIFQYDQANDVFARQDVGLAGNDSDLKGNDSKTSHGSITNVNVDKDSTVILETLVGNFDGNTSGDEQIILLHYNKWYGSEYVYATSCSMDSGGLITAKLGQVWKSEKDKAYAHPAIGAVDIFNQGVHLEFEPTKSTFAFSNPTVLAVLGATPYYKELEDQYGALGNVGTTYGNESESGSSESNGITANFGVSFGYEKGYLFDNIKIGFETEVTNSFTTNWTSAKSISKSISYTGYYSDDAVVATVIPYDIYYYKVYTYDALTNTTNESEICMNIPYSPMTTIMPLQDYNKAAAGIENAPVIGEEVLQHTVGDPRSYPQSSSGLSNVEGQDALLGGTSDNEAENFVAAGTGNNSVEQSITTSSTSEKSFDYELNVEVSFNINVFGLSAGTSAGVGYTRNATVSSTASTIRTGAVASVPQEYSQYNFNWCLVAYNYDLAAGDSTQECTVISYLVKPIGSFPPAVPNNLKISSQTLQATTLQWDATEGAAGYRVARSSSENGTFSDISGNITGKNTTTYTDSNVSPGQTYYYQIVASAAKDSLPTEPLQVITLSVSSLSIKQQPQLIYEDGDALDLSALSVTMKLSDGTTQDVTFAGFSDQDLTTSLSNEVALTASQTGTPITVKYEPVNLSANTNNLTVNAKNPFGLIFGVTFKVGTVNNATALAPNQTLAATIDLSNKQSTEQKVLVLLALYSDKGTMEKNTYQTATLAANASSSVTAQLALPANVTGYKAKVFAWDGTSFSTTTLLPKSTSVQIPNP